ncbi:nucleoside diphosphate-linked moiety X motif 19 [Kryptolebias marmoratus]|uniref:Acyl-coenzyme A diphosphatase NUDT19 n=1 Tax=Kryptolebias marmoratus TaxID=37003 RepID=A0A3Q3B6A3_KRYMA|nr:nucleoside diphosphate-linked moiety X motif 19 [Kryptolebias marmoratus]
MNTALRHWKEAATLILAAGHRLGADNLSRTPRVGGDASRFEYDVLLLKRSSKSGFMPNAHVFPGGMVDSSDFSSDWLDIFKPFASSPSFGLRRVKQPVETRAPIFATDRLKLGSPVPGEVALRICALRETFEESGVLLAVSKKEETRLLRSVEEDGCPAVRAAVRGGELAKWRALVNRDPSNFIRMCRELELLPNIWALHEWSNWLTPEGRPGRPRFDTAFFLCCLQETPSALQDAKEIVQFQWATPSEILQSYREQQLWIPPPQFYELSRLCRFPSLNDLHKFAYRRATEGCEQWMPVVVSEDDHYTSLMPGDKLYPLGSSGLSQAEDRQDDSGFHRIVFSDPYTPTLQISIKPKYNHLLPVVELAVSHTSKSHL